MKGNPAMISCTYSSPLGELRLVADGEHLRAVLWPDDDPKRAGLDSDVNDAGACPVLEKATQQLDEYFAGTRHSFDLPLAPQGTEFQQAAWRGLVAIPYGETRTYGQQATSIGRPTAVRAIGAANGRNPLSIVVPCHRVIGADGSLTGFAGGMDAKRYLLQHEVAHRAD